MANFQLITSQVPGVVTFENYEEVRSALARKLSIYSSFDMQPNNVDNARRDLEALKEDRDIIAKAQKDLEKAYSKPFADVNEKLNELIDMVDQIYKPLKKYVNEAEKQQKEEEIRMFAAKEAVRLGETGKQIIESPAFFNSEWLQKKYTVKKYHAEIRGIISQAARDLSAIQAAGGKQVSVLTAQYISSLSMEQVRQFQERLGQGVADTSEMDLASENEVRGYRVLKITATEEQMATIMSQMELMGVEVEVVEDGMPKPMEELVEPTFDSFVAFDIETSGTFGAGSGDDEAKITEIGAVRVVNGRVTERFDELANPGRKIVPCIARLTHITDEMVADKPPVDEVIRVFASFCKDSILVGHNIKSSDLYYIMKAAKHAGVRMENAFLDTYLLAKKFKEEKGWEHLNLGYLSEYYGIEHKDKHRAWSDAEANAEVYFRLKQQAERR